MRILFCCEYYYPSIGGVQVVIQQIAEHFAAMGHDVTVATRRLLSRKGSELNGVHIKEFSVVGNWVGGMKGEIGRYQEFVRNGKFDVVMIKAAQQWTFDALWPVLEQVSSVKVFIPCGFSGLYVPAYAGYFQQLPDILRKFDHLIFYASDYRDINFVKEHGIRTYSIVPNGASEFEFGVQRDLDFRHSLGIGDKDFVLLTVGSFTGLKGHLEVTKAFDLADFNGRPATLILNGNKPVHYDENIILKLSRVFGIVRQYGLKITAKHVLKTSLRSIGVRVGKDDELQTIMNDIGKKPNKKVLVTDLPRPALVQAFMAADLFIFASSVEYSPLVLYESAGAGTPFLTVPVGNAEEIAQWTEAGVICPARQDAKGYTRVDPSELAQFMSRLSRDEALRKKLGAAGKRNWQEKFTWEKISQEYEAIFLRLLEERLPSV
jgi:glycosyltransferase involved in cell wall biosynthesis